jgi:hypothetical protein
MQGPNNQLQVATSSHDGKRLFALLKYNCAASAGDNLDAAQHCTNKHKR